MADLQDRPSERIDATFRNGSIAAISVLLGFSLSFLARWSSAPGPWSRLDLTAVAAMAIGIASRIVAVALLLSIRSLEHGRYRLAVRLFLIGLGIVAAAVTMVIVGVIVDPDIPPDTHAR